MNFYIDSGGTIIAVDPERVYQGSAMANTIRLIAPFPLGASVTVSYILPDGTQMQPQLMTANKTLSGIQTETGVNFSVWEQNIGVRFQQVNGESQAVPDFTVLSQVGKVGVVFTITQANAAGQPITQTTARSSFLCERGAALEMPPEAFDDYESLLNQILGQLSVAVQNSIDLEANKVNRAGDTMTGALNIEEGGRFASYEADGINVDGEKMFFPEESGTLVTNKELAAVADNISKAMTEQADTLASGLVGSITIDFAESSNNLIVELFNGKNQTKDIITVNLPFSLYALKSAAVANVEMYLDQTNYVLSLVARNANNETISSSSVDFPVESMVVNARFDEATKELVLVLKNGNETRVPIGDIVSGLIPSSEKGEPNGVATLDSAGTIPDEQIPNSIGRGGTWYKVPMDLTETYLNVPVGYWTSVHGRLPRHGDFVLSANGSICRVTSSSETAVTLEYLFNISSVGGGTVDLTEYVKFTDIPTAEKAGPIKVSNLNYGLEYIASQGALAIKTLLDSKIEARASYAREAVTLAKVDDIVIAVLSSPLVEMTAEEKASACDWLGAVAKPTNTDTANYVILWSGGAQSITGLSNAPGLYTIPRYDGNKNIKTNEPKADLDCVNKDYVDNLPDNLTLTAEEQAAWRGMIGATKLYRHTISLESAVSDSQGGSYDKIIAILPFDTKVQLTDQQGVQMFIQDNIEHSIVFIADDSSIRTKVVSYDGDIVIIDSTGFNIINTAQFEGMLMTDEVSEL